MGRWSALVRQSNFAALLTAGGASLAAPTASLVVLSWALSHAYPDVSNGQSYAALALALLGLSSTVPTLVAAVFSGTLADRVDRNYLMRLVNLVAMASTIGIAAILIARPEMPVTIPGGNGLYLPLWVLLVYPFWAAETTAVTIFRPAFNASLPRVVARPQLGTANGLVYATALLLSIVASLAASGILSVVGWGLALVVPVAFFLSTQVALGFLKADLTPHPEGPRRSFLDEAVDGYRYLWRRRELFELTVSALAINFFSAVAFVELSLYATFSLGVSNAILLGALISGGSLGAAAGTLAVNRFRFERRAGRFLAVLTVCQGLTVVALGFIHSIWFALPTMFLFGLFPGMFMTVFLATIQATVPNQTLGRVLAADEVGSYGLVPVGQWAGGLLTASAGVSVAYVSAGIGTAAIGGLMASVRNLRALGFDPQAPDEPAREDPTPSVSAADPASS